MGRKLQAAIMAADSTYILAGASGQEVQRSKAANQSIVPKPEALARPGVFRFLEPELQAVLGGLRRILETELGSSGRRVCSLNHSITCSSKRAHKSI